MDLLPDGRFIRQGERSLVSVLSNEGETRNSTYSVDGRFYGNLLQHQVLNRFLDDFEINLKTSVDNLKKFSIYLI